MDIPAEIRDFNIGRDPDRLAIKYRNMREDPFVFLRGTCHLFYDRMPTGSVPRGTPATWLCGDLHLQNFGSYRGDNQLAYFDVNDFDEAALGPASWDLLRLTASVFVAADSLKLHPRDSHTLCTTLIDAYAETLARGKARWIERATAQGQVRELLDRVGHRQRVDFLDSRTTSGNGKRHLDIDGKHALPVTDKQRQKIGKFMASFAATQKHPQFYEVIDVARRVAGTGSLGVERYVVLVQGKGSPDQNYLLDLKQAQPSSVSRHLRIRQPRWASDAQRIAALQRRMQAVSMAFLQPVTIGKRAYVLRALQPTEDRVALDVAGADLDALSATLTTMGELLAWMQLRSAGRDGSAIADELIEFGSRRKWRGQMLAVAEECAAIVREDWKVYCGAYDEGFFGDSRTA